MPEQERTIRVTIIDDKASEFHLVKPESVIRDILDPDTPDVFIEVPVPEQLAGSVKRNFLHTSRIARMWLHDELTEHE